MKKTGVGGVVRLTPDAVGHYGKEWAGVKLNVTHSANKYMPAKQFYEQGRPSGYHPGYDDAVPDANLYDVKRADTGEELSFSLYDWEVQ